MSSRTKIIINVITLVIILLFAWLLRDKIVAAWGHIQDMIWWLLILQIGVQFLHFMMAGNFYYSFLRQMVVDLPAITLRDMYKFALEMAMVVPGLPRRWLGRLCLCLSASQKSRRQVF